MSSTEQAPVKAVEQREAQPKSSDQPSKNEDRSTVKTVEEQSKHAGNSSQDKPSVVPDGKRPTDRDNKAESSEDEEEEEDDDDDDDDDDDSSEDSDEEFPDLDDFRPRGKVTGPVSGGSKPTRPSRPGRP